MSGTVAQCSREPGPSIERRVFAEGRGLDHDHGVTALDSEFQKVKLSSLKRVGILTSGGDAPGMNAATRAFVRVALNEGLEVYAIREGYEGLIQGGEQIHPFGWDDVGGILHRGGTVIGSARSERFRSRDGRREAALNLLQNQIDGLLIVGGDGTLTGAQILREEWPSLVDELVELGQVAPEMAARHRQLAIVGFAASIDNDFSGTDMTIGADTALHRIVDAVDAIASTAASHQRSFVVEVMGRNCGYLAMMGALASAADWVLIPESPPNMDNWEEKMCSVLKTGRDSGRRDSIVIVAEGARDRHGNPISGAYVRKVLEERLGEDTRLTVLGHVQRGGSPTAFDRNLSTSLGASAVGALLEAGDEEISVIGMRGNRIVSTSLSDCLADTMSVQKAIEAQDFESALARRGSSFQSAFRTVRTLVRANPHEPDPDKKRLRIAVMHGGAPAPGMNTAVRAAVRLGQDQGHFMLAAEQGFQGLAEGKIREIDWMAVNGWAGRGGAELGTNRYIPSDSDYYSIAKTLEEHRIEALLMIGGWSGYAAVLEMYKRRNVFKAFDIPVVCIPASIDNNLPGSELSIGADTALNSIVESVDKIKQSAVASRRTFVVEVMGQFCGYLALMGALATGAERVYLHEEGVRLSDLQNDVESLKVGFRSGKRLGLIIRNEQANVTYTTPFMCALFEEEGGDLFDVRKSILGHVQQGGNPSPFDRITAIRLAAEAVEYVEKQAEAEEPESAVVGISGGQISFLELGAASKLMNWQFRRPKKQWWMELRSVARILAQSGPDKKLRLKNRHSADTHGGTSATGRQ